jgi:hypothetical protein
MEKLTKGLAYTPTIQLWDLTSQHILGQIVAKLVLSIKRLFRSKGLGFDYLWVFISEISNNVPNVSKNDIWIARSKDQRIGLISMITHETPLILKMATI